MLHQLCDVFSEKRERRISYHDVRLLQKLDAFHAAEIPVSPKFMDSDIPNVWHLAALCIPVVFEPNRSFRIMKAEQVSVLVLVAGGDELLQPQAFEVV